MILKKDILQQNLKEILMKILAISTSSNSCSVALLEDTNLIKELKAEKKN